MTDSLLLVGDIGGTNARFALADSSGCSFSDAKSLACADFASPEEAIAHYLESTGATEPAVICLAVAGPVIDRGVRLTNNPWRIDAADLGERFRAADVRLLNDFEAIALALPLLHGEDLIAIGPPAPGLVRKGDFTVAVLGPGTGLGVAGLMGRAGHRFPIVSEGSHVGFAPENPRQFEVLRQLRDRFGRVSEERLLSGPGLENVYWAICRVHGERGARLGAPDIFRRVIDGGDPHAREALELFLEALGQAAGNVALTMGAYDGVYIGGGILKRYPDLLRASAFRAGFENKGRYRSLMERIPTLLIVHPEPGLLGASHSAAVIHRSGSDPAP